MPWEKGEWLFWQYTEAGDGELYGVESKGIDLNYFNGDMAAFRARFNLEDMPPPPRPTPSRSLTTISPRASSILSPLHPR